MGSVNNHDKIFLEIGYFGYDDETYPEERGMENSAYLGMLKDEQGGYYYVFLEFPSGKQYAPSSEEAYSAAADTSSWIAENLEGRNGYTFEAGKESESAKE